ncbi:helix-turn-helix domain-containing protein [Mycobacterium sp. IS-1556]|uniref:helix-turn-helix domain-containing protein n=1 Tax=Mycobacterium sp. IS-1556 TaxID=1772276 RepID=UPI00074162E4|nr:helix-turn-helix domain-containing protein [Mycobacterium sp. IS-1556]KUH89803.1 hypothetical protein AU187_16030 [Mycobacterium sp. IS-1556]
MITNLRGVFLDAEDADYVVRALELLARTGRPSARLEHVTARLRKTVAALTVQNRNGSETASLVGTAANSRNPARYDLVTTGEAARILGITPNGVRYLARQGRLPAHHTGTRWLYPALAVVERAERQAAKRG